MRTLTLATRNSRLALAQSRIVIDAVKAVRPGAEFAIKTFRTQGDRDRKTALWEMEGCGFFTSLIERKLLERQADIAVHSFKDMPAIGTEGLVVAAVCQRHYAEDALVSRQAVNCLEELPSGTKIGTSSPRRMAQIRRFRPDLEVVPIRGNVQTRIAGVDRGDVDAVVLARAGLERINLSGRISFSFDPEVFIPAPAQGVLAVQCRADDEYAVELAMLIEHEPTRIVSSAERVVLAMLHPGCHAPVGVYARIEGLDITITAFAACVDGSMYIKEKIKGPAEQADCLAKTIAERMLLAGAGEIINKTVK